jgi:hypothetical protein
MPRCAGIKRDGGRCTVIVNGSHTIYCYQHDPQRAGERRRNAARGGKAKASGELGRVKARLQTLADMVAEGQMDRADAAVISQIWGTYLRALATEMKQKEQLELIERLEALEEGLEQNKRGSSTWRA